MPMTGPNNDVEVALKTIDDVLAHLQVLGDVARDARLRLAAYPGGMPSEEATDGGEKERAEPVSPAPRPADPRQVRLTRRQQQVLELLAQGVSNRRIGRSLHITEQTVKSHLHMIYRKLGATDRTEAVVIALRTTLINGSSATAQG